MIEFVKVTKDYKNVTALNNFSVKIHDGEFVFLIGASGAGKSTFIRLLLRELTATSGKVLVDGADIAALKDAQIPYYRRRIGMVFQDFKLIPTMNVYENVAFAMRVTSAKASLIKSRVPEVLAMVGLTGREKAFPNELSGGEQQRVSIARALVNRPVMLIADEPTGNLDPDTSWDIMKLLVQINEQGTTVIMATHGKELVDTMEKRVLAFDHGSLVRDELRGRYSVDE
ncbi:cell division ATP-binding protein FtsE [Proteiniclasticum sp. QWL-01]|uniref:cell division ATP-binding protein FtsE n=1 Tax=Proteiniclasticum sp. QWL-01 TaxID=3036945 RepID=UPI0024106FE2|nr:cell division ATP-binding protein FtsE [Proteiniclasticum sp. QWL-01]WFF72327.1 cell division ATP-binding protein FtsE [Proteiniclasticum sp. QWL-01]